MILVTNGGYCIKQCHKTFPKIDAFRIPRLNEYSHTTVSLLPYCIIFIAMIDYIVFYECFCPEVYTNTDQGFDWFVHSALYCNL
jgi:hypothetical protein